MSILNPEPTRLIRTPIDKLSEAAVPVSATEIGNIKKILSKNGDMALVRDATIDRYAQAIVKSTNPETGAETTSFTKAKNAGLAAAFEGGMYEIIRAFAFEMYTEPSATLFSESGLRYEYDGDDQLQQDMSDIRDRGSANIAEQSADLYSVGCGSSLLYLATESQNISYTDVTIDEVKVAFADEIIEESEDGPRRPVNDTSIDEATVVVRALSGTQGTQSRWAAWFGESLDYPRGRMCIYWANEWHNIPPAPEAELEFVPERGFVRDAMPEEIANPFTWWRQEKGDERTPEYPFVVFLGDPAGRGTLLPSTGVSLYETSLEFDIASGVVLKGAVEGALGKRVLSKSATGNNIIPDSLGDVNVILNPGQTYANIGWGANNARDAQETILNQIKIVADAHHVPSFLIATDYTQFPSGVALRQAMQKMERYRQKRINLNRSAVSRRFQIERALVNMSEGDVSISSDVNETWIPGKLAIPEDPKEVVEVAKQRMDLKVDDMADTMQTLHDLETREQAFNFMEQRKEDQERLAEVAPGTTAAEPALTPGTAATGGGFAARFGGAPGVRT
jgi:hypothetical protein